MTLRPDLVTPPGHPAAAGLEVNGLGQVMVPGPVSSVDMLRVAASRTRLVASADGARNLAELAVMTSDMAQNLAGISLRAFYEAVSRGEVSPGSVGSQMGLSDPEAAWSAYVAGLERARRGLV